MRCASREFSANDYNRSRDDYAQGWRAIDETLYHLCRDHPHHDHRPRVNAKILIIGRTYATGIERKVPTTGAQGGSISQVADLFYAHREKIDQCFVRLAKVSEPLTTSNIPEILTIHGLISKYLTEITRRKQLARSFVSKYLHFHARRFLSTTVLPPQLYELLFRFEKSEISRSRRQSMLIQNMQTTCGGLHTYIRPSLHEIFRSRCDLWTLS